jgi:4'-phosphopantetheinyl transferase
LLCVEPIAADCRSGSQPNPRRNGAHLVVRECASLMGSEARVLAKDEVHVWHALTDVHRLDFDPLEFLSPDERQRMERFRFGTDSRNFLFCRSMLRMLLASYLGTSPAELRFAYSAHGKPSLSVPADNLQFNVSHSHGAVLYAFSRGRRIGVDVELIRHDLNAEEIATRFFSPAEQIEIARSPDKYDAFFHCWTRKEAFVKARGEGLSCPLDSFDVSVSPDGDEVSLTTRPDSLEAQGWHLRSLNSFPGYAAAVAVESEPSRGSRF